jgi:hypothetical protein
MPTRRSGLGTSLPSSINKKPSYPDNQISGSQSTGYICMYINVICIYIYIYIYICMYVCILYLHIYML